MGTTVTSAPRPATTAKAGSLVSITTTVGTPAAIAAPAKPWSATTRSTAPACCSTSLMGSWSWVWNRLAPSPRVATDSAQFFRPPGESEVVEDHRSGMPGGEDQASPRPGDSPYPLSRFDKPRGRARRIYAPASRILLPVRRVADLEGHGLVGLFEAHVPQQILHPERVGFIVR